MSSRTESCSLLGCGLVDGMTSSIARVGLVAVDAGCVSSACSSGGSNGSLEGSGIVGGADGAVAVGVGALGNSGSGGTKLGRGSHDRSGR